MKRLRLLLLMLTAITLLAGVALFHVLSQPHRSFQNAVFIEIPKGTGAEEIATRLAAAGVIPSKWHLLLVKALTPRARWQAGEYRFEKPATPWEVASRLQRGDIYLVELRIPEGYNLYDIAALIEAAGLTPATKFIATAKDPALIRDLAPQAPTLEGFLFPSTYHVPRKISAEALCRMLTEQFRKEWKALNGHGDALRTVTLASLVEKETGAPEERRLVAGLYVNRLNKGMKLEADPTTIYAAMLSGNWRGTIYRSDLQRQHPYNTYAVAGLPPGPIANPGRSSLHAALQPQSTDYIFFVARPDGSGKHVFSKSYADHARAVDRYRRGTGG
jgi:UPF0755 protein